MQNFIIKITQENKKSADIQDVGCFILADTISPEFATAFTAAAQKQGKLVLTEGSAAVENYLQYKADGFIVDTAKDSVPQKILKQLKEQHKKAVIGAICRNRRHEAMLVSECEPDFVIFKFWADGLDSNRELLQWYNELFLIQCAAQIEENIDFSSLNADFIILPDTLFLHLFPID